MAFQLLVEQAELQALAVHLEDEHRLAGAGRLGGHVGRVLGDQDVVGAGEEGEVGVVAFALPDDPGQVFEARGQQGSRLGRRAARKGHQQRAAVLFEGQLDLLGDLRRPFRRQVEGLGPAADQHRRAWMRQGVDRRGEARVFVGQLLRRHPMRRADDRDDVVALQPVMVGRHDQIEQAGRRAGVLDLNHEGLAAGPFSQADRQGQGGATRGHDQIRPRRVEVALRGHPAAGKQGQPPRQASEATLPADALDDDLRLALARDSFGQTDGLGLDAGAPVGHGPDHDRRC